MKQYLFITIVFSFFLTSPAYAWRCGQKCPSSIFSGKLECKAHNAACKARIPKPTFNKPTESGFGHVPVSPGYEQRRKEKERYKKQRAAEKRRYEQALRNQKKAETFYYMCSTKNYNKCSEIYRGTMKQIKSSCQKQGYPFFNHDKNKQVITRTLHNNCYISTYTMPVR